MAASRSKVLSLYKTMLRESQKFSSYGFRNHAVRRIQETFRANKEETDPSKINDLIKQADDNLQIIKRQVIIGQMYQDQKLVIEKNQSSSKH